MELTYEAFGARGFLGPWASPFPFAAANAGEPWEAPAPAPVREVTGEIRRRILVVEDHLDTLRSMTVLLERLGYDVLSAENMADALLIAEREHFDILLSDIGLPDGSGLELVRKIRQQRNVSALALSGFGMEEDVQRSREAGFFDHLTKPISIDRLKSAISALEAQGG
jgi:CheY-like chemotaxis protein